MAVILPPRPIQFAQVLMPRGFQRPELEQSIKWEDFDVSSEASVHAHVCGEVGLVVERAGRQWEWKAIGFLGVRFGGGEAHSRAAAKRAAVFWWGHMTVTDRERERAQRANRRRREQKGVGADLLYPEAVDAPGEDRD